MSESDPIDLSNLMNLQFRPDWVEDLSKKDPAAGEVVWGRAPGSRFREERDDRPRRDGGPPRRDGGRGFDRGPRPGGPGGQRRDDRGPRPDFRGPRPGGPGGPRPEFRGPPGQGQGQGDRRPPPRGDRRDDGPRGPRRDDRGGGRPPFRGGDRDRNDRFGPRSDVRETMPLEGWIASLLPDQRAVDSIVRQIKSSGRAFAVFDVGRLFMKSRGSYLVAFNRRNPPPPQKPKEGQPPPPEAPAPRGPAEIYRCEADGSLWVTRDEAMRHILHSPALAKYYKMETVTVDAPKGNWNSVAVCGFSGALLGPPNHHDYQRNVARLHRERFSDMPLDRFKSRIRVEKDEALLTKWQEQQSTVTQWVPVTEEPLPEGTEPPAPLKSQSEMEAHFMRTHAPDAVKSVSRAAVPGSIPARALSPGLFALLRREVDHQQRFPMQLVQYLCRALENQGLRFFKRDKKNTFVCKNRPHFLPDDMVLSDRIRTMVEIVRANPGIKYSQLVSILAPSVVLAAAPPQAKETPAETEAAPAAEAVAEVSAEAPAPVEAAPVPVGEAPAVEVVASETEVAVIEAEAPAVETPVAEAEAPAAEVSVPVVEEPGTEVPAAGTEADAVAVAAPVADAEAPAAEAVETPAAPAPAPPAPQVHLSPEEIAILQDLHWLVQEGYVTEFQNGELFVLGRPPQPPQEKKPRPPRPDKPRGEAREAAPGGAEAPSGEAAAAAEGEAPPAAPEIEVIDAASVSAAVPEAAEGMVAAAEAATVEEAPVGAEPGASGPAEQDETTA